ncbi:hypothetical protein GMRT_10805 [Giardia muris]|uniref:Uncharacterized protein n=1 Tax=Giardia muris TaxID=5742 RepID=A0A4Z1SNW7_GIAMU|nr:hypothetical protein GMRT_10805 [Giardia muris]|eukprot:TNJ27502.1 hypothetical protein GMRT_10805 [Giardia muris]
MDGLSEVEEFNLRRAAIQNTVSWEFEMWRRERQAHWERELADREAELRQSFDKTLEAERQQLDEKYGLARRALKERQERLTATVATATKEAAMTERVLAAVYDSRDKAKEEYERACDAIQAALDKRRATILQKAASAHAKAEELTQRVAFLREQWSNAEERLRMEVEDFAERRRAIASHANEDIPKRLEEARAKIEALQMEVRDLEAARAELLEQHDRALVIEAQLSTRLGY